MANAQLKDWLGYELGRNKANSDLYVKLLKKAIGKLSQGSRVEVLIGHHITFELGDGTKELDINTENEIPSADCLMFDHDIMDAVFGRMAIPLMIALAGAPCGERDVILGKAFAALEKSEL